MLERNALSQARTSPRPNFGSQSELDESHAGFSKKITFLTNLPVTKACDGVFIM